MAKTSLWHLYLARNCPQHLPNNSITTAGHKAGLKGAQHPAVYYLHALHLTSLSRCRSLCKRWELFFVKPGVDSINGIPYYLNKCQKLLNISQMTFFFQEDSTLVHMHCACNTVQLLRLSRPTSFLLNHAPNSPSWMHWLQDLGSHTAAWVWVMSQKDWRNQGTTGWILAMHWYTISVKKCDFCVSRFAR